MRNITRREFAKKTARIGAGLAVSNIFACNEQIMENGGIVVGIPMPIQIVIDDVGWWSGEDGSARQEPYRTGIARNHVPADYQAIVDLGRGLGIQPQAAMILCEWDKENILQNLPSSTWMGEKWDNKKWVGPWLEEAAEIILNNKKHFEFTIHGVGHEYWTNGKFTRAEWADRKGVMRPRGEVEAHLDFFEKLMNQNDLGAFPTSFIPTAFLHGFGLTEGQTISMAEVLKGRGISYINTPFGGMSHADRVTHTLFGLDAGVMTIDRGEDLFHWNIIGAKPETKLNGPTCGLHWPNLLHEEPDRNSEIVNGWVKYLMSYNNKIETILAEDTTIFQKQLAHHICTKSSIKGHFIDLDFSATNSLPDPIAGHQFILKLSSALRLQFKSESIKIISDTSIMENDKFLYTIMLERIPKMRTARIEYAKAG